MWTSTRALVTTVTNDVRERWNMVKDKPEAGYASEAVLVTALLVIGAIIAISILVAKVNSKANDINLATTVLVMSGVL